MPGQFSSTNFFISPDTSPTATDLNIYKWVMEPSENILEKELFLKKEILLGLIIIDLRIFEVCL